MLEILEYMLILCKQDELSLLTRTYLVEELGKSFSERRNLIAYATRLNNDIAQLEKDKPAVVVNHKEPSAPVVPLDISIAGVPPPVVPPANFKSPSGRRRRNVKHRNKAAAELDLLSTSRPLEMPTSAAAATMLRPAQLRLPSQVSPRTVNGSVIPPAGLLTHARALQHPSVDNRPGSSSSTDSAESVRHLEQGACVSNFEHFTPSSLSLNRNGGGAVIAPHPLAIRRPDDLIPPLALPSMTRLVSFPSSRTEMEQYKLMVHGSASVPSNTFVNLNTRPLDSVPAKAPRRRGRKRASDSTGSAGDVSVVAAPLMLSTFPQSTAINLVNYLSQQQQKVFGGNPQFGVLPTDRMEVRSDSPRQFIAPLTRPGNMSDSFVETPPTYI